MTEERSATEMPGDGVSGWVSEQKGKHIIPKSLFHRTKHFVVFPNMKPEKIILIFSFKKTKFQMLKKLPVYLFLPLLY